MIRKLSLDILWPYVLIIAAGLLFCYPSLHIMGVGFGDDLPFHVYRYHSVLDGFKDGQLLPQLDPWAANGFGHSWNIFYGPLSAYMVTILRAATCSWAVAVNAFIVVSIILSGIFMYRFITYVSKQQFIGLFAALLFMGAPYHLTDIYIRQAHGELLAFIFIPLVFHGLYKIIHGEGGRPLVTFGVAGLLLSHNLSSLMVLFFAVLYALLNINLVVKRFRPILLDAGVILLFVFGLTSFFTLPMLEAKTTGIYNIFDSSFATTYMGMNPAHLESWSLTARQLLVNPHPVHPTLAIMPFALGGITFVAGLLFVFAFRWIPRVQKHFVSMMFGLGILALLLTTTIIPWKLLPHAALSIQFPWRFLMLFDFFVAVAGAYGLYHAFVFVGKKMHREQLLLLLALPIVAIGCVVSSSDILRFGQGHSRWNGTFTYSEEMNDPVIGTGGDEYVPRDIAAPGSRLEKRLPLYLATYGRQPAVGKGTAKLSDFSRDGSHAAFSVQATGKESARVVLPYLYYPGYRAWIVKSDGTTQRLTTSSTDHGYLAVELPPAQTGIVRVRFGASKATVIGLGITGVTVFVGGIVLLRKQHAYRNYA